MISGGDIEGEALDLLIVEANIRSNDAGLRVDRQVVSLDCVAHSSVLSQIGVVGKDLQESGVQQVVLLDIDLIHILLELRSLIVDIRDVNRQSVVRSEPRFARIGENQMENVAILLFAIQRLVGQENERRVAVGTVDVKGRDLRRTDSQVELQRRVEIRGDEIGDDHFLLFHFRLIDGDLLIEDVGLVDDLDRLQGEIPGQQRRTIVDIVHIDDHVGVEGNLISVFTLNDQFPSVDRFVVQRMK